MQWSNFISRVPSYSARFSLLQHPRAAHRLAAEHPGVLHVQRGRQLALRILAVVVLRLVELVGIAGEAAVRALNGGGE